MVMDGGKSIVLGYIYPVMKQVQNFWAKRPLEFSGLLRFMEMLGLCLYKSKL